jgi:hypothetical protein
VRRAKCTKQFLGRCISVCASQHPLLCATAFGMASTAHNDDQGPLGYSGIQIYRCVCCGVKVCDAYCASCQLRALLALAVLVLHTHRASMHALLACSAWCLVSVACLVLFRYSGIQVFRYAGIHGHILFAPYTVCVQRMQPCASDGHSGIQVSRHTCHGAGDDWCRS